MFKHRIVVRSVLLIQILVFTANSLLVHAVESNFWKERQIHLASAKPAVLFPPLSSVRETLATPTPVAHPSVSALMGPHGTIRKIQKPARPNGQTVILIQDIHSHNEAQNNIQGVLRALASKRDIDLIALEGGSSQLDFYRFHRHLAIDERRELIQFLKREKNISGPIELALAEPSSVPLFGIEEDTLYQANIRAYVQSQKQFGLATTHLQSLEKEVTKKRPTISTALVSLGDLFDSHHRGDLAFSDYALALRQNGAALSPGLEQLLEAVRQERSLDFSKVASERSRLIERLTSVVSAKQLENLTAMSVAFRSGQLTHAQFYRALQNRCRNGGVSLSDFPTFDAYISYVLLSESLNIEALLADIQTAEQSLFSTLTRSNEDEDYVRDLETLSLTRKLIDFSLTTDEWHRYKTLGLGRSSAFREFENFYLVAEKRDNALSQNLTDRMENQGARRATLVMGGFHSAGLTRRLLDKGISVVTFVPRVTKIEKDGASEYLTVFSQEKTPLDKLLLGEKLFLSPPLWTPVHNRLAGFFGVALRIRRAGLKDPDAFYRNLTGDRDVAVIDAQHKEGGVDIYARHAGGTPFHVNIPSSMGQKEISHVFAHMSWRDKVSSFYRIYFSGFESVIFQGLFLGFANRLFVRLHGASVDRAALERQTQSFRVVFLATFGSLLIISFFSSLRLWDAWMISVLITSLFHQASDWLAQAEEGLRIPVSERLLEYLQILFERMGLAFGRVEASFGKKRKKWDEPNLLAAMGEIVLLETENQDITLTPLLYRRKVTRKIPIWTAKNELELLALMGFLDKVVEKGRVHYRLNFWVRQAVHASGDTHLPGLEQRLTEWPAVNAVVVKSLAHLNSQAHQDKIMEARSEMEAWLISLAKTVPVSLPKSGDEVGSTAVDGPNALYALRNILGAETRQTHLELTHQSYQRLSRSGAFETKRLIPHWTAENELKLLTHLGFLEVSAEGQKNIYMVAPWLKQALHTHAETRALVLRALKEWNSLQTVPVKSPTHLQAEDLKPRVDAMRREAKIWREQVERNTATYSSHTQLDPPNLLEAFRFFVQAELVSEAVFFSTVENYQSASAAGKHRRARNIPQWTSRNELDGLAQLGLLEKQQVQGRVLFSLPPWIRVGLRGSREFRSALEERLGFWPELYDAPVRSLSQLKTKERKERIQTAKAYVAQWKEEIFNNLEQETSAIGQGTSLQEIPTLPVTRDLNSTPRGQEIEVLMQEAFDQLRALPSTKSGREAKVIRQVLGKMQEITAPNVHRDQPQHPVGWFQAVVRSPEDYLLGFSRKDTVALSFEVVYAILDSKDLPRREDKVAVACEYFFHEAWGLVHPEKHESDHRRRYTDLQRAIFGRENRLKPILRGVVTAKLAEQVAPPEPAPPVMGTTRKTKFSPPNLLHALRAIVAGEIMTSDLTLTQDSYQSSLGEGQLGPVRVIPDWTARNELDALVQFGVLEKTEKRGPYRVAPWLRQAIADRAKMSAITERLKNWPELDEQFTLKSTSHLREERFQEQNERAQRAISEWKASLEKAVATAPPASPPAPAEPRRADADIVERIIAMANGLDLSALDFSMDRIPVERRREVGEKLRAFAMEAMDPVDLSAEQVNRTSGEEFLKNTHNSLRELQSKIQANCTLAKVKKSQSISDYTFFLNFWKENNDSLIFTIVALLRLDDGAVHAINKQKLFDFLMTYQFHLTHICIPGLRYGYMSFDMGTLFSGIEGGVTDKIITSTALSALRDDIAMVATALDGLAEHRQGNAANRLQAGYATATDRLRKSQEMLSSGQGTTLSKAALVYLEMGLSQALLLLRLEKLLGNLDESSEFYFGHIQHATRRILTALKSRQEPATLFTTGDFRHRLLETSDHAGIDKKEELAIKQSKALGELERYLDRFPELDTVFPGNSASHVVMFLGKTNSGADRARAMAEFMAGAHAYHPGHPSRQTPHFLNQPYIQHRRYQAFFQTDAQKKYAIVDRIMLQMMQDPVAVRLCANFIGFATARVMHKHTPSISGIVNKPFLMIQHRSAVISEVIQAFSIPLNSMIVIENDPFTLIALDHIKRELKLDHLQIQEGRFEDLPRLVKPHSIGTVAMNRVSDFYETLPNNWAELVATTVAEDGEIRFSKNRRQLTAMGISLQGDSTIQVNRWLALEKVADSLGEIQMWDHIRNALIGTGQWEAFCGHTGDGDQFIRDRFRKPEGEGEVRAAFVLKRQQALSPAAPAAPSAQATSENLTPPVLVPEADLTEDENAAVLNEVIAAIKRGTQFLTPDLLNFHPENIPADQLDQMAEQFRRDLKSQLNPDSPYLKESGSAREWLGMIKAQLEQMRAELVKQLQVIRGPIPPDLRNVLDKNFLPFFTYCVRTSETLQPLFLPLLNVARSCVAAVNQAHLLEFEAAFRLMLVTTFQNLRRITPTHGEQAPVEPAGSVFVHIEGGFQPRKISEARIRITVQSLQQLQIYLGNLAEHQKTFGGFDFKTLYAEAEAGIQSALVELGRLSNNRITRSQLVQVAMALQNALLILRMEKIAGKMNEKTEQLFGRIQYTICQALQGMGSRRAPDIVFLTGDYRDRLSGEDGIVLSPFDQLSARRWQITDQILDILRRFPDLMEIFPGLISPNAGLSQGDLHLELNLVSMLSDMMLIKHMYHPNHPKRNNPDLENARSVLDNPQYFKTDRKKKLAILSRTLTELMKDPAASRLFAKYSAIALARRWALDTPAPGQQAPTKKPVLCIQFRALATEYVHHLIIDQRESLVVVEDDPFVLEVLGTLKQVFNLSRLTIHEGRFEDLPNLVEPGSIGVALFQQTNATLATLPGNWVELIASVLDEKGRFEFSKDRSQLDKMGLEVDNSNRIELDRWSQLEAVMESGGELAMLKDLLAKLMPTGEWYFQFGHVNAEGRFQSGELKRLPDGRVEAQFRVGRRLSIDQVTPPASAADTPETHLPADLNWVNAAIREALTIPNSLENIMVSAFADVDPELVNGVIEPQRMPAQHRQNVMSIFRERVMERSRAIGVTVEAESGTELLTQTINSLYELSQKFLFLKLKYVASAQVRNPQDDIEELESIGGIFQTDFSFLRLISELEHTPVNHAKLMDMFIAYEMMFTRLFHQINGTGHTFKTPRVKNYFDSVKKKWEKRNSLPPSDIPKVAAAVKHVTETVKNMARHQRHSNGSQFQKAYTTALRDLAHVQAVLDRGELPPMHLLDLAEAEVCELMRYERLAKEPSQELRVLLGKTQHALIRMSQACGVMDVNPRIFRNHDFRYELLNDPTFDATPMERVEIRKVHLDSVIGKKLATLPSYARHFVAQGISEFTALASDSSNEYGTMVEPMAELAAVACNRDPVLRRAATWDITKTDQFPSGRKLFGEIPERDFQLYAPKINALLADVLKDDDLLAQLGDYYALMLCSEENLFAHVQRGVAMLKTRGLHITPHLTSGEEIQWLMQSSIYMDIVENDPFSLSFLRTTKDVLGLNHFTVYQGEFEDVARLVPAQSALRVHFSSVETRYASLPTDWVNIVLTVLAPSGAIAVAVNDASLDRMKLNSQKVHLIDIDDWVRREQRTGPAREMSLVRQLESQLGHADGWTMQSGYNTRDGWVDGKTPGSLGRQNQWLTIFEFERVPVFKEAARKNKPSRAPPAVDTKRNGTPLQAELCELKIQAHNDGLDVEKITLALQRYLVRELAKTTQKSVTDLKRSDFQAVCHELSTMDEPITLSFLWDHYDSLRQQDAPNFSTIEVLLAHLGLVGPQIYDDSEKKKKTSWQRLRAMVDILGIKRIYLDLDETTFWAEGWVGSEAWYATRLEEKDIPQNELIDHETRLIGVGGLTPTDPHVVSVLNELHAAGVEIVGLTARTARSRHRVNAVLTQMGLEFMVTLEDVVGQRPAILYAGSHRDGRKADLIDAFEAAHGMKPGLFIDNNVSYLDALERRRPQLAHVHTAFYEDNRHKDWLSPTWYYFQATERSNNRQYDLAQEDLINALELSSRPLAETKAFMNPNERIQLYQNALDLALNMERAMNGSGRTRLAPFYASLLRSVGELLAQRDEATEKSSITEEMRTFFRKFFPIYFPHHGETMVRYWESGLIVVRRGRGMGPSGEFHFLVNESNVFAYVEPVLRLMRKEKPSRVIVIDSGARPLGIAVEEFFKHPKWKDSYKPTVCYLPLSLKTHGDTLKSTRHWLALAQQVHSGSKKLSSLSADQQRIVKAFLPLFPLENESLLILDDNMVEGDTLKIAAQALGEQKPREMKAAVLCAYRDGKYNRSDVFSVYSIPGDGRFNWYALTMPVGMTTSWEEQSHLRGVQSRPHFTGDPTFESLTSSVPGYREAQQFLAELRSKMASHVNRFYDLWSTDATSSSSAPSLPDHSIPTLRQQATATLAQREEASFRPQVHGFDLEVGERRWQCRPVETMAQFRSYIEHQATRHSDFLLDQHHFEDWSLLQIFDEKDQLIGFVELVAGVLPWTRQKNGDDYKNIPRALVLNHVDLNYIDSLDHGLFATTLLDQLEKQAKADGFKALFVPRSDWLLGSRPELVGAFGAEDRILHAPYAVTSIYPSVVPSLMHQLSQSDFHGAVQTILLKVKALFESDRPTLYLAPDARAIYREALRRHNKDERPDTRVAKLLKSRFDGLSRMNFRLVWRDVPKSSRKWAKDLEVRAARVHDVLLDDDERRVFKIIQRCAVLGVRPALGHFVTFQKFERRKQFFESKGQNAEEWQESFADRVGKGELPVDIRQWPRDAQCAFQGLEAYHQKLKSKSEAQLARFPSNFFEGPDGLLRARPLFAYVLERGFPGFDLRSLTGTWLRNNGLELPFRQVFQRDLLKVAEAVTRDQYALNDKKRLEPRLLTTDHLRQWLSKDKDFPLVPGRSVAGSIANGELKIDNQRINAIQEIPSDVLARVERNAQRDIRLMTLHDPNMGLLLGFYRKEDFLNKDAIPFAVMNREGKFVSAFVADLEMLKKGELGMTRPKGHAWTWMTTTLYLSPLREGFVEASVSFQDPVNKRRVSLRFELPQSQVKQLKLEDEMTIVGVMESDPVHGPVLRLCINEPIMKVGQGLDFSKAMQPPIAIFSPVASAGFVSASLPFLDVVTYARGGAIEQVVNRRHKTDVRSDGKETVVRVSGLLGTQSFDLRLRFLNDEAARFGLNSNDVHVGLVMDPDYGPALGVFASASAARSVALFFRTVRADGVELERRDPAEMSLADYALGLVNRKGRPIEPREFSPSHSVGDNGEILIRGWDKRTVRIRQLTEFAGQKIVFRPQQKFKYGFALEASLIEQPADQPRVAPVVLVRDPRIQAWVKLSDYEATIITDIQKQQFSTLVQAISQASLDSLFKNASDPSMMRYVIDYFMAKYPHVEFNFYQWGLLIEDWLTHKPVFPAPARTRDPLPPVPSGRRSSNGNGGPVTVVTPPTENGRSVQFTPAQNLAEVLKLQFYSELAGKGGRNKLAQLKEEASRETDPERKEALGLVISEYESAFNLVLDGLVAPDPNNPDAPRLLLYQIMGIDFLLKRPDGVGVIADDPGMGKTVQGVATAVLMPRVDASRPNVTMVVAPKSAVNVWHSEIVKWTSHDCNIVVIESKNGACRWYQDKNMSGGIDISLRETMERIRRNPPDQPVFVLVNYDSFKGGLAPLSDYLRSIDSNFPHTTRQLPKILEPYQKNRGDLVDAVMNLLPVEKRTPDVRAGVEAKVQESYGTFFNVLESVQADMVFLDEAHRLKNVETLQAQALARLNNIQRRILFTATPLLDRSVARLFPLVHWLAPARFPTLEEFEREFPDTRKGRWDLSQALRPLLLRRRKYPMLKGIIPEPAPTRTIEVEFTNPADKETYRRLEHEYENWLNATFRDAGRVRSKNQFFAWLQNLVWYTSGLRIRRKGTETPLRGEMLTGPLLGRLVEPDAESESIAEVLEEEMGEAENGDGELDASELTPEDVQFEVFFDHNNPKVAKLDEMVAKYVAEGRKIIIFTRWREVAKALRDRYSNAMEFVAKVKSPRGERLNDVGVAFMDGTTTRRRRQKQIDEFQKNPDKRIFITTYGTGGESVTLTAASRVILFDAEWVPPIHPINRAHRLGQKQVVESYYLVLRGTIDGSIVRLHEHKRLVLQEAIEGRLGNDGFGDEVTEFLAEKLSSLRSSTSALSPVWAGALLLGAALVLSNIYWGVWILLVSMVGLLLEATPLSLSKWLLARQVRSELDATPLNMGVQQVLSHPFASTQRSATLPQREIQVVEISDVSQVAPLVPSALAWQKSATEKSERNLVFTVSPLDGSVNGERAIAREIERIAGTSFAAGVTFLFQHQEGWKTLVLETILERAHSGKKGRVYGLPRQVFHDAPAVVAWMATTDRWVPLSHRLLGDRFTVLSAFVLDVIRNAASPLPLPDQLKAVREMQEAA